MGSVPFAEETEKKILVASPSKEAAEEWFVMNLRPTIAYRPGFKVSEELLEDAPWRGVYGI